MSRTALATHSGTTPKEDKNIHEPYRPQPSTSFERPFPRLLRLYWIAVAALTALAYSASAFFAKILHRDSFPFSPTLLPAEYNGGDFTCFQDRFHHFGRPEFFAHYHQPFNYPAPLALVYELFYGSTSHALAAWRTVAILAFIAAAILFSVAVMRRGIRPFTAFAFGLSALLLSYPVALVLYLANIETAVWIATILGVWAYAQRRGYSAAVCFGIAASFKFYPLVFLGLPFARRRYREVAVGVLAFIISMVSSLWLLGPTIPGAYRGLQQDMKAFTQSYFYEFHSLEGGMDHSLFNLVKLSCRQAHHLELLQRLVTPYLACVALAGVLIYFLRIRKLPLTNQVLALSIAAVLLPPISHDYTLVHLYAPWGMLTFAVIQQQWLARKRSTIAMYACFALLFTPQNYLIRLGTRYGGPLKSVALIVLFVLALVSAIPDTTEQDPAALDQPA